MTSYFSSTGRLENSEIQKRLLGSVGTEKLASEIGESFWFRDYYNSFISDPVFLEHLVRFLKNNKPPKFNRFDFYHFLFDETSTGKSIRSHLQKIALVFERIQSQHCMDHCSKTQALQRENWKSVGCSESISEKLRKRTIRLSLFGSTIH